MRQMRKRARQWRTGVWAVVIIGLTGVAYADTDTADLGWYETGTTNQITEISVEPGVPFDVDVGVLLTDNGQHLELGGYEMDIVDDSAWFGSTATPGVTLTARSILPTGWFDVSLTPPPIDLWKWNWVPPLDELLDAAAVSLLAEDDLPPGLHMLETLTLQVPASVAPGDIDYYLVILDLATDPGLIFAASGGGKFVVGDVAQGFPLHITPEPASLACLSLLFGASLLRRRRR